jgi:hypothetical protein
MRLLLRTFRVWLPNTMCFSYNVENLSEVKKKI